MFLIQLQRQFHDNKENRNYQYSKLQRENDY
jgi:hypothetical protein